jgi:hypothetical protein
MRALSSFGFGALFRGIRFHGSVSSGAAGGCACLPTDTDTDADADADVTVTVGPIESMQLEQRADSPMDARFD